MAAKPKLSLPKPPKPGGPLEKKPAPGKLKPVPYSTASNSLAPKPKFKTPKRGR